MTLENKDFYNKCNLTLNPFRPNPIHETDPRSGIWASHDEQREQLTKKLTSIRADQVGQSHCFIVYGELGAGKSHALLWARHLVMHQSKEEFKSVAYYIQTIMYNGKISLAHAFDQFIVRKSELKKDLVSFRNFIKTQIQRYRQDNSISESQSEEDLLSDILPSVDLTNFLKPLLSCDTEPKADEFIRANFSRSVWTDEEVVSLITQIINSFTFQFPSGHRFKNAVYLLIDELDTLLNISVKDGRLTNDKFRHLYDNSPEGLGLIFALTATAAELPQIFSEAMLSRTSGMVELHFFDQSQAKTFIKTVLNSYRVNHDDKSKLDFYPFDEDTIEQIISSITNVTPRKIMRNMHHIIEEVRINEPNAEIIDWDIIEKIGLHDTFNDMQ